MSENYLLTFISETKEQKHFLLDKSSLKEIDPAEINPEQTAQIIVLPACAALPFVVKLPFCEERKVARVLPQFVMDIYSKVTDKWLFCWKTFKLTQQEKNDDNNEEVEKTTEQWQIHGLAFPSDFSQVNFSDKFEVRLAIADIFLVPQQESDAIELITPVSHFIASYSTKEDAVKRILPVHTVNPPLLKACNINKVAKINLLKNENDLINTVEKLLNNPQALDMSGWKTTQKKSLQKTIIFSVVSSVLLVIFISHFFLWINTINTERAAQRTQRHIQSAFSEAFPNTPLINPVAQATNQLEEARERLTTFQSAPQVDWQLVLSSITTANEQSSLKISRLYSNHRLFQISGTANSFASVENLEKLIKDTQQTRSISIPELRQIDQKVVFSLEGQWKK